MGKFFSIPGADYSGKRMASPLPRHPGAEEFYKNRSETSHTTTGLVGTKFLYHGDAAVGLHEERNHDGTVDLIFARSEKGASGTMRMRWHPGAHARQMVSGETKRVFE